MPGLIEELPPPQRLALSYAPASARRHTLALLVLDARLAASLRKSEPVLAQVRLAWWRDTLRAQVDSWPDGDELLQLLREWRHAAALVPLVDGWEALLSESLDAGAVDEFAEGRAAGFAQLARELDSEPAPAAACARVWALGDLAAHLANPDERQAAIAAADGLPRPPLARKLRPLAVLSALARRSLARGGAALLDGSAAALLAVRVGVTGR